MVAAFTLFSVNAFALSDQNMLDELDPRDPNIENILRELDAIYSDSTGLSPFIGEGEMKKGTCFRNACPVWARVNKMEQKLYLYVDGVEQYVWTVSTGKRGYVTPFFDTHPDGRVYDRYSSSTYPGGDYNGLGNMPYAVFIRGGFAVHGTVKSNWPALGTPASKGCVRLHPDHGFIFNRLVRSLGVGSVWITVE